MAAIMRAIQHVRAYRFSSYNVWRTAILSKHPLKNCPCPFLSFLNPLSLARSAAFREWKSCQQTPVSGFTRVPAVIRCYVPSLVIAASFALMAPFPVRQFNSVTRSQAVVLAAHRRSSVRQCGLRERAARLRLTLLCHLCCHRSFSVLSTVGLTELLRSKPAVERTCAKSCAGSLFLRYPVFPTQGAL